MIDIILLIADIVNLAVLLRVYWVLKRVGKEINAIERYKSMEIDHYF